jgi:hypothetical protein
MTARIPDPVCSWSERCFWVREPDGTETLIPMCIGSANHPSQCTCSMPQSRIERAEEQATVARGEVDRLRQKLLAASDRASRLTSENLNLLRRLREATA